MPSERGRSGRGLYGAGPTLLLSRDLLGNATNRVTGDTFTRGGGGEILDESRALRLFVSSPVRAAFYIMVRSVRSARPLEDAALMWRTLLSTSHRAFR